jgi:hypothetical protein
MIKQIHRLYTGFFHFNRFQYDYREFVDYHFLQTQITRNKNLLRILRSRKDKDLAKFYDDIPIDSPLSPNPLFDPIYFLNNLNASQKKILRIKKKYGNLFNYFLNKGYKNQIDPHEFFSFSYLRVNTPHDYKSNIWVEYVKNYRYYNLDVSPNFNGIFYLLNNTDVAESGMNPLLHYVQYGKTEGRSATEQFTFNSDGYNDIFKNTRISRKLIKPIVSEPLKNETKVIYELNEKPNFDSDSLTLIINDAKSGFIFPTDENVEIRNVLERNIGIDIDLIKMDQDYVLRKIKNLYNEKTEFDYVRIILPNKKMFSKYDGKEKAYKGEEIKYVFEYSSNNADYLKEKEIKEMIECLK